MSVFAFRPKGYKLGLAFLAVGFIFYVVGFSSPFWTTFWVRFHVHSHSSSEYNHHVYDYQHHDYDHDHHDYDHDHHNYDYDHHDYGNKHHYDDEYYDYNDEHHDFVRIGFRGHDGLWKSCFSSHQLSSVCVHYDQGKGAPAWVAATQGVQCVGLIAMIVSLAHAMYANWIQKAPGSLRITESASGLACFLGFIGCIVFAMEIRQDIVKVEEKLKSKGDVQNVHVEYNHVAWAFGVSVTGCSLVLIATILVARYNQSMKEDPNVITGASFTSAVCSQADGSATTTATAVAVTAGGLATVVGQPVLADGGAVAMAAPAVPATTKLYFIHPQQMAGGFHPPPYDPRQVVSFRGENIGATGGAEVCLDDLPSTKEEQNVKT